MKRLMIAVLMLFVSGCAQNPQHVTFVHQDALHKIEKEKPLSEVTEKSPEKFSRPMAPYGAQGGETLKPAQLALLTAVKKHRQAGNLSLAASALERAIRINPRAVTPYRLLADLSLEQGELEVAAELARKALTLISTQGNPHYLMSEKIKLIEVLAAAQGT